MGDRMDIVYTNNTKLTLCRNLQRYFRFQLDIARTKAKEIFLIFTSELYAQVQELFSVYFFRPRHFSSLK